MSKKRTIIQPKPRWQFIDFKKIYEYRELFWTLVTRDIKVRYKQTFIGGLWAIIQPLSTMVVFTIFFGRMIDLSSANIPYPIFSYAGLTLWIYFSSAISSASNSLVSSSSLITKVYFPRIIIPLASTFSGLIDYAISTIVLFGLMFYYQVPLTISLLLLPILAMLTWVLASGIGLWLSAVNVKYRDVRYAVPFFISLLLFASPVIYPVSIVPELEKFLILNPMTGIIQAHRSVILSPQSVDLSMLYISILISIGVFIFGSFYFRSVEKYFADIV